VLIRDRKFWYRDWARPHAWPLIILVGVGITTLVVVITQRPRPEYLYPLTVGLLVLVGLCLTALARRLNAGQLLASAALAVTVTLIAVVPQHYRPGLRPIFDAVHRLQLERDALDQPNSVLIANVYNGEICSYLAYTSQRSCASPDWTTVRGSVGPSRSIRQVLDRARATVIYATPTLIADPVLAPLLAAPNRYGWRQVAAGDGLDGPWRVLVRA
jgi:hypothetical protein